MTDERLHSPATPVVVYFPFMTANSAFIQSDMPSMAISPEVVAIGRFPIVSEDTQTSKESVTDAAASRFQISTRELTRRIRDIGSSNDQEYFSLPAFAGESTPH